MRRLSALASRAHAFFSRRALASTALGAGGEAGGASANGGSSGGGAGRGARHGLLGPNISPEGCALEDLLLWLAGYRDLFSKPCAVTGKLLAWDPSSMHPLPPVFRPFRRALAAAGAGRREGGGGGGNWPTASHRGGFLWLSKRPVSAFTPPHQPPHPTPFRGAADGRGRSWR